VFKIFADTHKIIATNINDNVFKIYGFKLDEDSLLWGAISPDILPKYRIIRHYKDESIDYISKEIIKIIFVSRFIEFNQILDPFALKLLSKKIGVISHYLSDYVCLPHAKRWTFKESMIKHIKYEIDIYDGKIIVYKSKIKSYIEDVVEEYSMTRGFESDLDFALSLNLKITYFIIDTIHAYSEDVYKKIAMEL